jgi:hypothetical protein
LFFSTLKINTRYVPKIPSIQGFYRGGYSHRSSKSPTNHQTSNQPTSQPASHQPTSQPPTPTQPTNQTNLIAKPITHFRVFSVTTTSPTSSFNYIYLKMNRFSGLLRPRLAQAVRSYSATPVARMADDKAAAANVLRLNFATPNKTFYQNTEVDQLIVPGLVGEYGVTAGHQPVVSELKPGVLKVYPVGVTEPEEFFVSGGFALTHEDSVTGE